jgi:hypothetical protein
MTADCALDRIMVGFSSDLGQMIYIHYNAIVGLAGTGADGFTC